MMADVNEDDVRAADHGHDRGATSSLVSDDGLSSIPCRSKADSRLRATMSLTRACSKLAVSNAIASPSAHGCPDPVVGSVEEIAALPPAENADDDAAEADREGSVSV